MYTMYIEKYPIYLVSFMHWWPHEGHLPDGLYNALILLLDTYIIIKWLYHCSISKFEFGYFRKFDVALVGHGPITGRLALTTSDHVNRWHHCAPTTRLWSR